MSMFETAKPILIIIFGTLSLSTLAYFSIIKISKLKNKNINQGLCILVCVVLVPILSMLAFFLPLPVLETTEPEVYTYNIICNEESECFTKDPFNGTVFVYDKNGEKEEKAISSYNNFEVSPDENNYFVVEKSEYINKFYDFVFGPVYKNKFLLTEDTIVSVVTSHNKGEY